MLRGGAFYDLQQIVRCAFRYSGSPDYHFSDVGFRVVVRPSSGL